MGYAGNPLRSCRIPLVQVLPLNLQNAGYLIQLSGKIPGDSVFRNRNPAPVHQPVQPVGDGTQSLIQPVAGQDGEKENQKEICAKHGQNKKGNVLHGASGILHTVFGDAFPGIGNHKKALFTVPDPYRIIQQIPAAEGSHLSHGIMLLYPLRQIPSPDPRPVIAQQEGKLCLRFYKGCFSVCSQAHLPLPIRRQRRRDLIQLTSEHR